jgi:membrane protease subunit (stomatin/prohibitin family)
MNEGMDLLNKMKSMPGMGDMSKIFSQMGIPGLDKNTKVNMGAMEAQMNKNMKMAQMKERMRAKSEQKAQAAPAQATHTPSANPALSEEELIKIFISGEKGQKTPRGAKPPQAQAQDSSSKKKKGKK